MSSAPEGPQDAITGEEMAGTAVPGQPSTSYEASETHKRPNAFTELLSSKKPRPKLTTVEHPKTNKPLIFSGRDGLAAYTIHPESFSPDRVIYHTDEWVVINDLYPKSSVHILLLPRDTTKNVLHPFDAFEDPTFLASVQAEVAKLRDLVASELRRKYGRFSASERARIQAMEADEPPAELPPGRDWTKDVISGIHAHPSMNHLHIHVLSADRFSPCMRHRKHYNSFNTPFLVPVEDFPLAKDDKRRHPGRQGYLDAPMACWRCRRDFGNKFSKLKEHLAKEFEEWKQI